MNRALRGLPALLAAVLLSATLPSAGEDSNLSGTVVSSSGTGLSGALLTLRHEESGRTLTTGTGERGLYRAGGLAAGGYVVTVELPGFTPATRTIMLVPGQSGTLDFVLSPSGYQERITVTAVSPRDSLEAADVRRSPARDVGEALSALPGVWALRKGGIASDLVVRGLQGSDTTLLIDGERIYGACPNRMDPPAFHVDFAEVDRIEVAKGPFDMRNAGSLGGGVNVVTRPPEPGWHSAPFLAGGSWGYVNPSATLSYGGNGLSATGGASYRVSAPYEDGSGALFTESAGYATRFLDDDAFRVGTAWAKAAFEPSKGHSLQFAYTRQEADHLYYPYLLMDAIVDDTDRAKAAYELTRDEGILKGVRAETYVTRVNHWMTDQYRLSGAGKPRDYSMGTLAESRTLGGKVEARMDRLTVGFETYQRLWDATTEMAGSGYVPQRSVPGAATNLAGLYADTEQTLTGRWKIAAGARVDRAWSGAEDVPASTDLYFAYNNTRSTSSTDTYPSASLRFLYRSGSLEFSAGAGSAVRVPDPNERYISLRRMGSDWVGNPDLVPIRDNGADLTLILSRPRVHVSGSLYGNRLDDNIVVCNRSKVNPVPGVMNSSARSYANTGATLRGAEAEAVATLTGHLFLSGDVSFVRGTQEPAPEKGIVSGNLAEIPPQRLRAALRYDTGTWWTEAEGVFSGAQTRVDTDLLEQPTPAWEIANLRGGIQRGPLTVTAGVTNLFNRTYHEHLSYQRDPFRSGVIVNEPGRGFFLNAGYRF